MVVSGTWGEGCSRDASGDSTESGGAFVSKSGYDEVAVCSFAVPPEVVIVADIIHPPRARPEVASAYGG